MARPRRFTGEVIVLTGATSGIGRELALQLAGERARLALAARDRDRLAETVALCAARGAEAFAVPTDVADRGACARLIAAALERWGRIDVLLLDAGQEMWARLDELADLGVLERVMRVNYFGCAWLAAEALPHLVASRGQIVVVSSLAGLTGVPTRTGYAASKHALHGFFDSLRCELHGSGVAVTLVCPDFVRSEMHRRSLGADGRPLGVSPLREEKLMTAAACARAILDAARRRKRLALLSWRGKVGRWVRLVAPGLIDRLAIRAVARGH